MMKKILGISVLLAFVLPAVASENTKEETVPVDKVSMEFENGLSETPPVPVAGACSIALVKASDSRPNKETIGHEFRPILSGDPAPWIASALDTLKQYGYQVKTAEKMEPVTNSIVIHPDLYRSYTWHGHLRINGMVAMKLDILTPSGKRIQKKYRASGSKTNWAGGTNEYMTALNYAMNNVIEKLAKDMVSICNS